MPKILRRIYSSPKGLLLFVTSFYFLEKKWVGISQLSCLIFCFNSIGVLDLNFLRNLLQVLILFFTNLLGLHFMELFLNITTGTILITITINLLKWQPCHFPVMVMVFCSFRAIYLRHLIDFPLCRNIMLVFLYPNFKFFIYFFKQR